MQKVDLGYMTSGLLLRLQKKQESMVRFADCSHGGLYTDVLILKQRLLVNGRSCKEGEVFPYETALLPP